MLEQQKLTILTSIFVSSMITANLIGSKITTILGINMSVSIFVLPLTFLITDAISEVYGKKKAQELVYGSMVSVILIMIVVALAVYLPPADRFTNNESYVSVFSSSIRIMLASLIAFVLSQGHDIWAFDFWKKKTHGKFLWLRNNLSTFVSQFLDTTLFMFLAFYQMTPKFDVAFVFSLIIPWWLIKVAFAFIDTPFVYGIVHWLKSGKTSQE